MRETRRATADVGAEDRRRGCVLREGGVVLVSRIAGLLLSAIAVQLIADAVRAFIACEG